MQCKMIVMDARMRRCGPTAGRTRRAMERFDLQKYDERSERQEAVRRVANGIQYLLYRCIFVTLKEDIIH